MSSLLSYPHRPKEKHPEPTKTQVKSGEGGRCCTCIHVCGGGLVGRQLAGGCGREESIVGKRNCKRELFVVEFFILE